MTPGKLLGELLDQLVSRTVASFGGNTDKSFETLLDKLHSVRGDIPALKSAAAILSKYASSDPQQKITFFDLMAERFDLDTSVLAQAIANYSNERSGKAYEKLQIASEAPRLELFRRLNRVPGGTLALVRMREDLLNHVREVEGGMRIDADFRHLFASWFNRGFLVLRDINWTTPAHILEKIIAYEAVHQISSWDELRARTEPSDRHCFAFFHPAIADEPLVFVEVALTKSTPASIGEILDPKRSALAPEEATTAVFYSISNCQKGLQGISFGNFLIKQVAEQLRLAHPRLREFVTLSPVPGFAAWLASDEAAAQPGFARIKNTSASGERDAAIAELAATYLVHAKRSDGKPLDPVARFHLANGAILDRLNINANNTGRGVAESLGVMVNYRYDLANADANHEQYFTTSKIKASRQVRDLSKPLAQANPPAPSKRPPSVQAGLST